MLLSGFGPATQKTTLKALALLAHAEDRSVWEKYFGRVLILVLDCLEPKEVPQSALQSGGREAALLCLQELVVGQTELCTDFAEVVASKLFDAYRSCSQVDRHIAAMVDRTLERLLGAISFLRALEILMPMIGAEAAPLLQLALRLLSALLQRMPSQEVLVQLDTMLPSVVAAFSNPNPDVRKAAVFCLVDIYMSLGEQAMPHLIQDLTPSQVKLVTIYIGRQQREREELSRNDPSPATQAS